MATQKQDTATIRIHKTDASFSYRMNGGGKYKTCGRSYSRLRDVPRAVKSWAKRNNIEVTAYNEV